MRRQLIQTDFFSLFVDESGVLESGHSDGVGFLGTDSEDTWKRVSEVLNTHFESKEKSDSSKETFDTLPMTPEQLKGHPGRRPWFVKSDKPPHQREKEPPIHLQASTWYGVADRQGINLYFPVLGADESEWCTLDVQFPNQRSAVAYLNSLPPDLEPNRAVNDYGFGWMGLV